MSLIHAVGYKVKRRIKLDWDVDGKTVFFVTYACFLSLISVAIGFLAFIINGIISLVAPPIMLLEIIAIGGVAGMFVLGVSVFVLPISYWGIRWIIEEIAKWLQDAQKEYLTHKQHAQTRCMSLVILSLSFLARF